MLTTLHPHKSNVVLKNSGKNIDLRESKGKKGKGKTFDRGNESEN